MGSWEGDDDDASNTFMVWTRFKEDKEVVKVRQWEQMFCATFGERDGGWAFWFTSTDEDVDVEGVEDVEDAEVEVEVEEVEVEDVEVESIESVVSIESVELVESVESIEWVESLGRGKAR